ncbi:MAG: transcriptional regulator, TetR family [Deltaproteobacteria bacterium]|nr:transcriptional regulator, TetR family [Deltaproteobacteria bacterium]
MAKRPGKGPVGEGDVRERLLASAAALFSTKGYAATTVREIVERAGVTKPAMYYYFRSKEGIYLDLMQEPLQGFIEHLRSAMEEKGTARERLVRVCLLAYDDFVRNLSLARVMFSIYYGPPQGAPFIDFDAVQLRFQECLVQALKEGIRCGEFRKGNPTDMMWTAAGAVNVAMELELCRPGQSIGREGIVRMLNIIFDGIAGDGRGGTGKGKRR